MSWNSRVTGQSTHYVKNSGIRIVIGQGSAMYSGGHYTTTSSSGTIALDGTLSITGSMTADTGTLFTSADATGLLKLSGIPDHYLTQTGTVNVDGLEITDNGSLVLTPKQFMTVKGPTTMASGADYILQSSDSVTASLITEGSATGNVTVQRHIENWTDDNDGWHLLSSPVENQPISPMFTIEPVENYDF